MNKKIICILTAIIFIFGNVNAQTNLETDSLSLQNAIEKALENNYGIVTSKMNKKISEINNNWGNTGAIPTISFVGSGSQAYNFNDYDDYSTSYYGASVDVNWVIFRGFSARITKDKLEEYQKMSENSLALTVENTIVDVVLAYYNVLLTENQLNIAEKNMLLSKDRYDREERKKDMGGSVTYDLLQAKNSWLEDKASYMSTNASLKNAVRQLNYILAAPVNSKYIFTDSFQADSASFEFNELLTKMNSNNSTLKNQYINLETAKLDVKSAKSSYYPTVSANLSGGYSNTDLNYSTFDDMNNTNSAYSSSAGISLSYDIFKGGSRRRELQIAKIEEEIATCNLSDMKQALENQLAQEFEFYEVRKELLLVAQENLNAAELNLDLSKKKYESGAINSFNFRDIQTMYQNSALNYNNAVYNLIQSYQTLLRMTGGIIDMTE